MRDEDLRQLEHLWEASGDPAVELRLAVHLERSDGLAAELERTVLDLLQDVGTGATGIVAPAHVRRIMSVLIVDLDESEDLVWRHAFGAPNVHMVNEEEEVSWGVGLHDFPSTILGPRRLPYVACVLHYDERRRSERDRETFITVGIRGSADPVEHGPDSRVPYPIEAWPGYVEASGPIREVQFGPHWASDFRDQGTRRIPFDAARGKVRVPESLARRWIVLNRENAEDESIKGDLAELATDPTARRYWANMRDSYGLLPRSRANLSIRGGIMTKLAGPMGPEQVAVAERFMEAVTEENRENFNSLAALYETISDETPIRRQLSDWDFGQLLVELATGARADLPSEIRERLDVELRVPTL